MKEDDEIICDDFTLSLYFYMAACALSNNSLFIRGLLSNFCCSTTVWFRRGGWKGGGELYKSKIVECDLTKLIEP